MKIILLANGTKPEVRKVAAALLPDIGNYAEVVAVDFTGQLDASLLTADYAVVFGGDGSVLRAVNQLGSNQIPVLAVHLGTLGFLTAMTSDELVPLLRGGLAQYPVIEHLLLNAEIKSMSGKIRSHLALNEIVIHGSNAARLIDVELHIDGVLATTYRCDGLLVSTPVGSTARNLSTGGPILRKDIDAVVIAPICPHTLSNRPLVDSPNHTFELTTYQSAGLYVDGYEIAGADEPNSPCTVKITRAAETFKTLDLPGFCYYKALQTKLGWNV